MAMTDLIQVVRRKRKRWSDGRGYDEAIKVEGLRPRLTSHLTDNARYNDFICWAFGHRPKNPRFGSQDHGSNLCRCGASILREDGSETRISHVPSCFFLGHSCIPVSNRSGHHEFVCSSCGHPLLFENNEHPDYGPLNSLDKRQRYHCSFFGHQVHKVVDRDEYSEYACQCGHSFLKQQNDLSEIKHPLVCLYSGHFVNFLTYQGDYAEYLCKNCGHTFYYPRRDRQFGS